VNTVVKDVMTANVIAVGTDAAYEAVAADLVKYRISAVPVVDQASRVIGVVSESDMLAKLALDMGNGRGVSGITGIQSWEQLQKARAVTAAELMTAPVFTASPEDTIEQAARIMYSHQVKRLPVIDAEGRLTGIVTRTDLLAVYSRHDEDIAEEIRDTVFCEEPHAVHGPFQVTVQAGIVTLSGLPLTASQRWAIVRRARHIPGVVAVRDRLTHPAPGLESWDQLAR
jgi:CBS domain-containing protein